ISLARKMVKYKPDASARAWLITRNSLAGASGSYDELPCRRNMGVGRTRITEACFIHADRFGSLTIGTAFARRVIDYTSYPTDSPCCPGQGDRLGHRPSPPRRISTHRISSIALSRRDGIANRSSNEANMPTCTRRGRVSDLRRLGSGLKLARDEVKAGSD